MLHTGTAYSNHRTGAGIVYNSVQTINVLCTLHILEMCNDYTAYSATHPVGMRSEV